MEAANEYTPLNTSSTNSSNVEETAGGNTSNLSRALDDSIEKLDTIDDFASFKCYSSKEIANRVVTFNQIGLAYSIDRPVTAYFYAYKEAYEMNDSDTVGIAPMQQGAFLKKAFKDCEPIDFDSDDTIVTMKVDFDLKSVADFPGNSGYYQFVYQNSLGDILGLSTPFQFDQGADSALKNTIPQASPQASVSDDEGHRTQDEGFVVVPEPDAFLRDRYDHLSKANKLLDYLIRNMETELRGKCNEVVSLRGEGERLKKALELNQNQNQHLEQKCQAFEIAVNNYVGELNDTKQKLKEALESRETLKATYQAQLEAQKRELDNKGKLDLSLDEMQKILNDKQEEVNRSQALVAEYIVKNQSLESRLGSTRNQIESVQSNLMAVLDERNRLTKVIEADKQANAIQINKIRDLEGNCERLRKETVTMDSELRTTLANMKNVTRKYQEEREKAQKSALESDKMRVELAEMRTRLSSAREEYAKLWKMYQKSKAKTEDEHSSISNPVDSAVEFNSILRKQVPQSSNRAAEPASVGQLIDIDDSNEEPSSKVENTDPKKLMQELESSSSSSAKSKKTVPMPCVMCDQMIACEQYADDTPRQMYEMVSHLEEVHLQRMCPVCSTMFDTRLPIFETYFNSHVQSHFKNDVRYPTIK